MKPRLQKKEVQSEKYSEIKQFTLNQEELHEKKSAPKEATIKEKSAKTNPLKVASKWRLKCKRSSNETEKEIAKLKTDISQVKNENLELKETLEDVLKG